MLVTVTESLRSRTFDALQRDVARQESFEVYSSARGDVAAYVSLLNRAQLRLASLYERRGDGPERLVGRARFTQLWRLSVDGWRLARVFSYAHAAASEED